MTSIPRTRPTVLAGSADQPRLLLLLVILCLTASGCDDVKTQLPDSDSTPPSLVWNVFNHETRDQADHPGSPTLSAKRGDKYRIFLKANDPGGIKKIQINPTLGSGEISWQCVDPPGGENLAQNKSATLTSETQNLSKDSDGTVLTSIFLIFELDLQLECPSGWSLSAGDAKLTGRAENYFAGIKTEELKFQIAP